MIHSFIQVVGEVTYAWQLSQSLHTLIYMKIMRSSMLAMFFGNVPHVKFAEHRAYPPEYPYLILVARTKTAVCN